MTPEEQHDVTNLTLYAVSTGELYPARQDIQARMKAHIADGGLNRRTDNGRPSRSYYSQWFRQAAARYQMEIEPHLFSDDVIRECAIALAEQDEEEIRLGAL